MKGLRLPFIRGVTALFEAMYYGVKSMMYSANVALEEEDDEFNLWDYALLVGMLLLMNGIFIAVPFVLTNWLGLEGVLFNVVESLAELSRVALKRNGMSRTWGPNKGTSSSCRGNTLNWS